MVLGAFFEARFLVKLWVCQRCLALTVLLIPETQGSGDLFKIILFRSVKNRFSPLLRCQSSLRRVSSGPHVHLSSSHRILPAFPPADRARSGRECRRHYLRPPPALAFRLHRGPRPAGEDGTRSRLRLRRVDARANRRSAVRLDGAHPPRLWPAQPRCGRGLSARRPTGTTAAAHGNLRLPSLAPAQVPRPAPQRRLQFPRRLRFAIHSVLLRQGGFHFPEQLLDHQHLRTHVAAGLATHAPLARRRAFHAAGDDPLRAPHSRRFDSHCRARERRPDRGSGRPQLGPHGAGLRAGGAGSGSVSHQREAEPRGQSPHEPRLDEKRARRQQPHRSEHCGDVLARFKSRHRRHVAVGRTHLDLVPAPAALPTARSPHASRVGARKCRRQCHTLL